RDQIVRSGNVERHRAFDVDVAAARAVAHDDRTREQGRQRVVDERYAAAERASRVVGDRRILDEDRGHLAYAQAAPVVIARAIARDGRVAQDQVAFLGQATGEAHRIVVVDRRPLDDAAIARDE